MLSRPPRRRVAIVGGGLSGLAAAAQLHLDAPSVQLTLFEAAPRLGGVIQTERVGPFVIDLGADMFTIKPPAAIDLLRRLGADERLIEPKQAGRGAGIVHRGRLVPVPEGFVLMRATQLRPILTTPLLSPGGKLRLLAERFIPPGTDNRDQSVGSFVRRRLGREVLDSIVGPLIAGIYTADVEKLSMRATMSPLVQMVRQHGSLTKATRVRRRSGDDTVERNSSGARYSQFRSFPGGMNELIQTLAAALPAGTVRTSAAVESLQQLDDRRWQVTAAGEPPEPFDHVLLATPPRVAAGLVRPTSAVVADQLQAIESASTAIVVLAVRRSDIQRPAGTFGFVVPPRENRRILAASFASEKFAGRAPADQVLVRVFIGGALQHALLKQSDEELIAIAQGELGELIGLGGEPTLAKVIRWNEAMPQYHVGHLERVEQIEQAVGAIKGLSIVGNALHGVGITPVIASAGTVAAEIAERLG